MSESRSRSQAFSGNGCTSGEVHRTVPGQALHLRAPGEPQRSGDLRSARVAAFVPVHAEDGWTETLRPKPRGLSGFTRAPPRGRPRPRAARL